MAAPSWEKLWELFHLAAAAPPAERDAVLDHLCQDDPSLRGELESLLGAHQSSHVLLDQPASPQFSEQAFTPPDNVGPYRIERAIGSGGMGEVFLAHRADDQFQQRVAIKFATFARYSPALMARFISERQILSDLNHPNIARLLDGGASEGVPYLVMEYIEGLPVNRYCDQHQLNLEQRLQLFDKICTAVEFAHRHLVVHRDIKPDNILVGADGEPKLLDFGVAKLLHAGNEKSEATAAYGTLATPNFASPEQLAGEIVTTVSDVYSLGVLLYLLVCGNLPHRVEGQTLERRLAGLHQRTPLRPSDNIAKDSAVGQLDSRLKRKLAGDLDQIVLHALRAQPNRRYPSVPAFSADLRRFLAGLPVVARPDRLSYRAGKFLQRHPWSSGAAALFGVFLIGFSIITARQAVSLEQALILAQAEQRKANEVTAFLQDLFRVSDPLSSPNADITAADLLDQGRARLDRELQDQPSVRADLLIVLGTVYANLDQFDSAEALLREGIALQQQLGAAPAQEVAAALALARVLAHLDRYDEAQEVLEKALQQAQQITPPQPQLLARAQIQLGRVMQSLARLDTAEDLIRTGLQYAEQTGDRETFAEAQLLLGGVLWRQARYDDAATPYRQALDHYLALHGDTHHKTLQARTALGILHLRLGNLERAQPYLENVVETRREVLGQHTLTAAAQNQLGALYLEMGRLDAALSQLEAARDTQQLLLGEDAAELANTLNNLGLINQQLGRLQQAEKQMRQALKINQTQYGATHYHTGSSLNNLAVVLYDQQRFAQAQDLFAQANAVLTEVYGPDHPALAYSATNMGRSLLAQGQFEAARQWLQQALHLRRQRLDAGHPALAESLHALGELLLAEGQLQDAETLLKQALDIRLQKLPRDDWRTGETRNLYGAVLAHRAAPEAEDLMRQGLDSMVAALGPDHWRTQAAQRRLAARAPDQL